VEVLVVIKAEMEEVVVAESSEAEVDNSQLAGDTMPLLMWMGKL
jgi:hypothetical protein